MPNSALLKRIVFGALVLETVLFTWLNWNAPAMTGLIPYYRDFAGIIRAGFDPKAATLIPTFPMWGYGWVLLVFPGKLAGIVCQQLLAVFAVFAAYRIMGPTHFGTIKRQRALLVLVLASPAWFALHSVRWPNSIAASLLPISLLLIIFAVSRKPLWKYVVLSGFLFGALLNFRSDYILLPVAVVIALVVLGGFSRRTVGLMAVWMTCVYAMLVPWAAYTHKVTGHFLFGSTNGGHVFFLGLGNLPDNKWGISPDDGDPVMQHVLEKRFGIPGPSSLEYESDIFLKREFLRRVKADPFEFSRKVIYSAKSVVTKGAYPGEFYETPGCQPNCAMRIAAESPGALPYSSGMASPSRGVAVRSLISLGSDALSRSIIALSFFLLPFTILLALKERNLLAAITAVVIFYQFALSVVGYHMQAYNSNIYLFFLINAVLGGTVFRETISRFRPRTVRQPIH